MRQIILFDTEESHGNLLPLSYTRPVGEFRIGIRKLREVWEEILPGEYHYRPVAFQRDKFGNCPQGDDLLFINGCLLPDESLLPAIDALLPGQALSLGGDVVAFRGSEADLDAGNFSDCLDLAVKAPQAVAIKYVFDVF